MPAQCGGVLRAERGGHRGAPVAALRAVARVAQAIHQLGPGRGDAIDAPAGGRGLGREAEAGQGRADHVEGVGGIAAVLHRIDQRFDHLVELDDRTGPAMGDDQRHGPGVRRAHVEEMDVESVDLGGELREAIEQRFAAAPIVIVGPVPADLLDPLAAARPGSSRRPARPPASASCAVSTSDRRARRRRRRCERALPRVLMVAPHCMPEYWSRVSGAAAEGNAHGHHADRRGRAGTVGPRLEGGRWRRRCAIRRTPLRTGPRAACRCPPACGAS